MSNNDEILDITKELELPLSPEQKEYLKDPWNYFTLQEQFYIFYSVLVAMIKAAERGASDFLLGALSQDKLSELQYCGVQAVSLALWFTKADVEIPAIREGEIIQSIEDLNPEYVKWADSIMSAAGEDPTTASIWALRLNELITEVGIRHGIVLDAMIRMFKAEKHRILLRALAEAESDLAQLKLEVISEVVYEWREMIQSETIPVGADAMEDLGNRLAKDAENRKDKLYRLYKKRDEVARELANKIEEERPEFIKKSVASGINIPETIQDILNALNNNCEDPECPIHGANIPVISNQLSIKICCRARQVRSLHPIDTNQEGTPITMATDTKKTDLEKKDEFKFKNVNVQFVNNPDSKAIVLPEGMTLKEARHWLDVIEKEETRTFNYQYQFKGWYPLDAMWAAYKALAELHGFVHIGDFDHGWWGKEPPTMITIDIGYGETHQMPWGPIQVSSFSSPLTPSIQLAAGQPTLQFSATIRNNERSIADALMKRAEEMLKTSSIYRGKAIDVDFEVIHPADFRFDPTKAPKFWNTKDINIEELILPKSVERLVKTNIWTPIRKTEEARKHRIPLRRAVLLAGPYGVGKTLAAKATAKVAEDNGWTFVYLRNLKQLKEAIYFAKKYQPAVIFAEDINRITSGKRDTEMDELLNVMDGVDRKNDEVMLVFTTNNIEEIHPSMIRPGRIDTIITVSPPDAEATERLMRLYGRGLIDPLADLTVPSEKLAGQIPAIIREAVERAKLAAIEDNDGGNLIVRAVHLDITADQMLNHAEFLREPPGVVPDMELLGNAIGRTIALGLYHNLHKSEVSGTVSTIAKERMHEVIRDANLGNGHLTTTK